MTNFQNENILLYNLSNSFKRVKRFIYFCVFTLNTLLACKNKSWCIKINIISQMKCICLLCLHFCYFLGCLKAQEFYYFEISWHQIHRNLNTNYDCQKSKKLLLLSNYFFKRHIVKTDGQDICYQLLLCPSDLQNQKTVQWTW